MRARAWIAAAMLAPLVLALPACQAGHQGFAPRQGFALREGDLLFQDRDGKLADAINAVTFGVDGAKFCHVGIVLMEAGRPAVIEASKAVRITPLAEFLARSRDDRGRPRVVVGRLKPDRQPLIPPAIARARELLGRPYDDVFLLDNGKYYCSELVYEVFLDERGRHLFQVEPMTFRASGSSRPLPAWRDYFASRNAPIPEGLPGCNPAGLSRSPELDIVHAFGQPTGWSEAVFRRHNRGGR